MPTPKDKDKNQPVSISVKVDGELLKRIDDISKRNCRTRTGTVTLALLKYLNSEAPRKAVQRG